MTGTMPKKKTIPMRHCFNCGAEIGRYKEWSRFDTCGASECSREERHAYQAERDEAHEQLDRDMGYGSW